MNDTTNREPFPIEVLANRFDNAELVRVSEEARLVAVWSGGQTINFYDTRLEEVQTGPKMLSDENGEDPPQEGVEELIDEAFASYIENGYV